MDRTALLPVSVFARLAGVRRQTIYNRIEKDLAPYAQATTEGKRILAAALPDLFGKNLDDITLEESTEKDTDAQPRDALPSVVQELRARIAAQEKQIDAQAETIKAQEKLIDSAQRQEDKTQEQLDSVLSQLSTLQKAFEDTTKALAATSEALAISQEATKAAQALHAGTLSSIKQEDKPVPLPWWRRWRQQK